MSIFATLHKFAPYGLTNTNGMPVRKSCAVLSRCLIIAQSVFLCFLSVAFAHHRSDFLVPQANDTSPRQFFHCLPFKFSFKCSLIVPANLVFTIGVDQQLQKNVLPPIHFVLISTFHHILISTHISIAIIISVCLPILISYLHPYLLKGPEQKTILLSLVFIVINRRCLSVFGA